MSFKYPYPHNDVEVMENRWEEVEEREYYDALGCVPPAKHVSEPYEGFAVGEPLSHMDDGRVVYMAYVIIYGDYWRKPYPIDQFHTGKFHDEIVDQVS